MDWEEVRPLLERVLALPADERDEALAQECDGDEALLARLRALLAAGHERRELFEPLAAHDEPAGRLGAGDRAGPWRLVKLLGEGGMGRVWLAERADADFQQRVALKLIKHGMDTEAVLRRFRRERRVLAELDHPGIVRLLDGGATEAGQPYLVMELVQGTPLDVHCRERELALEDRLALFARVCDAVEAAHALGVVHRDLKPANVLVTASGEPKVLDFGIAKVLGEEGPEASLLTRTGERLLTPRYAAPEQVRGEECSAATDVYALGVMLYELLCGRPPYELEGVTPSELESTVCEAEARRPSSFARGTQRARLAGDLDVICLRALAKDPARRYLDAGRLARDLRRHLAHEPIEARPDSVTYRVGRFVRRNRLLVTATTAVILALAVGLSIAWAQYLEADAQRVLADRRAEESQWRSYLSDISTAYEAVRDRRNPIEILERAPEPLRGWEWHHLRMRGAFGQREIYRGEDLMGLALDAAGETLVVGDVQALVVLNAQSGAVLRRIEAPEQLRSYYRRFALSPDGRLVAFTQDRTVWIADTATGEIVTRLPSLGTNATGKAFRPDGEELAVCTDAQVLVMDTGTWETLLRFPLELPARSLAWSPDGRLLAAAGEGGLIALFERGPGRQLAQLRFDAGSNRILNDVAFSHDGTQLAAVNRHGVWQVWRVADLEPATAPRDFEGYCWSIGFRSGTDEVVVGTSDITAIDLVSGRERVLALAPSTVGSLAFHPKRPVLFAAAIEGRVLEVELEGEDVPRWHVRDHFVMSIALSPDASRLAVARHYLTVYDLASGQKLLETPHGLGKSDYAVSWHPSGETLVAQSNDALVVFEADTLEPLLTLPGRASASAFSADGSLCAVGVGDDVHVYATEDWSLRRTLSPGLTGVQSLVFEPSGRRVVALGGACFVIDPVSGAATRVAGVEGARYAAFAPGERLLAITSAEDKLAVLTWPALELVAELTVEAPRDLAFTPDGRRLLVGASRGIAVVDTARWELALAADAEGVRVVRELELTPDGETLVTCDEDGDIKLWRAPGSAVGAAEGSTAREDADRTDVSHSGRGRSKPSGS